MAEWLFSDKIIDYNDSLNFMKNRVDKILCEKEYDLIWFLEHNHVYTAGISASENEILNVKLDIPVIKVDRGGKYTYHGPGQRIIYTVVDLRRNGRVPDIKEYVHKCEQWVIDTLNILNINAFRFNDLIGVWIKDDFGNIKKIASIGIKVKKWITYHGISINVKNDLSFFNRIIPCGISNFGVTSINELGYDIDFFDLDFCFYKSKTSFVNV